MEPTPEQLHDIAWALSTYLAMHNNLMSRMDFLRLVNDYYRGNHRFRFATQKFRETFGELFREFAENLCPMVVDTVADMLQIEGFTSAAKDATIAPKTREIWRHNRMDERAGQQHKASLLYGDSYAIVWPDRKGRAVIHPNLPSNVVCRFDDEEVGRITLAARAWLTNATSINDQQGTPSAVTPGTTQKRKVRLNLYFPDRIEKYVTTTDTYTTLPQQANAFVLHTVAGEEWPLPNPWNKVPVFRFVNNAGPGEPGDSELANIIPLQDALNKAICDMMVAMEYEAYAQRYATGLEEVQRDENGNVIPPWKAGVERLWVAEGSAARFGEFSRADLTKFINVQNGFRLAVARVSGIPAHYFMFDKGGWPSGESLKTATERLTTKVGDRQTGYGNSWEDLMRFALEVEGTVDADVATLWRDTSPKQSETENWQTAQAQQGCGVSVEQTLIERGYTLDQIKEFQRSTYLRNNSDGFPPALPVPVHSGGGA